MTPATTIPWGVRDPRALRLVFAVSLVFLSVQGCGADVGDLADDMDVTEEVDNTIESSTEDLGDAKPMLKMRGKKLPEASSLGVYAPPFGADSIYARITLTVKDADQAYEGMLVINDRCKIRLFGKAARSNETRFTYNLYTYKRCINQNTYNDLKFVHHSGDGFDVFDGRIADVVPKKPVEVPPNRESLPKNPNDLATVACQSDNMCGTDQLCWGGFCRLQDSRPFHPGNCGAHHCYPNHMPSAHRRCEELGWRRATVAWTWQVAGDIVLVGAWNGSAWQQSVIGGGHAMEKIACTRRIHDGPR